MLHEIGGIKVVGQVGAVAEAKQAVRDLNPDVVILDLHMPGGSGLDVLKTMPRDHGTPTVIVLTNDSYPQYRKKCLESGAGFVFDKSTEFRKVAQVLQDLISNTSGDAESC